MKWRNAPEDRQYYLSNEELTLDQHMNWFHNKYLPDDKRYDFMIVEPESNQLIGTAGVKLHGEYPEVSYAISEKGMRGKGFAKDAINTLLRFVQKNKNAVNADAVIHKDNTASIHLVEGLGFEYAGKLPERDEFLIYRKIL